MKKYVILILSALCLVACQESKEEKAEKLIEKAFNSIIVNIDTYEPIETTVDSAYAPMQTPEMLQQVGKLPAQILARAELREEVERAQSLMSIYEDSYSSYGSTQYEQYKKEYETAKEKLDEMERKFNALVKKMEEMSQQEPVFNGWLVRHKYRYVSKDGKKAIGEYLFLMNKELTEIEAMLDLEDELIKAFLENIKESTFLE